MTRRPLFPDPPNRDPAIEFQKVDKTFQVGRREIRALQSVSLQIVRGSVTGLIGPDGAGKTTLMRCALGLLRPECGSISVLGTDVLRDAKSVQAEVGYMPQQFGLYAELTVRENLDLYADLVGLPGSRREERYDELLLMTGLDDFRSSLARKLSGGMQQKLGFACAFLRPRSLLILDEPTVGIDPLSRRDIWEIIRQLVEKEKTSVFLSTSYLDEAERCDEVVLLYDGEVLGQGPPREFQETQRGRTWSVSAPDVPRRQLQRRLAGAEGVVDAVLDGPQVRIVMEKDREPRADRLRPGGRDVEIQPVDPRFEDAFIAILAARTGPEKVEASVPEDMDSRVNRRPDETVIEAKDLTRRFGSLYAVRGISFEVKAGEVFGLLGANGAGKSTTFRMLCGLLPTTSGSVRVAGVDLRRARASARARIGYMSQKFSLYRLLSVNQNLDFFSSVYGLSGKRQMERVGLLKEQFGLGPVADTTSKDLPLGYKQRLSLACALLHEPEIVFLDEPTSGVDPLARREFWHRIGALSQQGVTVLVTTHFMREAEYCDRLAIMRRGKILAIGTPEKIKAQAESARMPKPTMEDAFVQLITTENGGER